MVRSEDEIRRYDIFKGCTLGLIAALTLYAYRLEAKASKAAMNRIGFSQTTPFGPLIETDPVVFSGTAPPGYTVYIITRKKTIASCVADDRTTWEVSVEAKELNNVGIILVCRDGNKEFDTIEETEYMLSEDLLKKVKTEAATPDKFPVEVKKPVKGEALKPGINAIFGTGVPQAKIKVFANKQLLEVVEADQNGDWKLATEFKPGQYRLSAVTPSDQSTVEFEVR